MHVSAAVPRACHVVTAVPSRFVHPVPPEADRVVGSVDALRVDWGQAVYDITKGALANLTNVMALDHGREIRVNAVHPGVTLSSQFLRAALAEGTSPHKRFVDGVPMGRAGEPAEVAAVVAFLASRDAGYLNGVTFPWTVDLLRRTARPTFTGSTTDGTGQMRTGTCFASPAPHPYAARSRPCHRHERASIRPADRGGWRTDDPDLRAAIRYARAGGPAPERRFSDVLAGRRR